MKHTIICGHVLDVLKKMPNKSVDTVITSPPYWGLRSYLPDDHPDKQKEIGLEPTLDLYLDHLLEVMQELKRVLKKTGVIFWNHADCYLSGNRKSVGHDPKYPNKNSPHAPPNRTVNIDKCLALQNFRFVLRCVDELGLILRDTIIWAKKVWMAKENTTIGNAMPTSANDRCAFTYEPVYVLVKSPRYYWDQDAIRTPLKEGTRERVKHAFNPTKGDIQGAMKHTGARHFAERVNQGDLTGANRPNVWQINLEPSSLPHYAVFPTSLVSSCLLAGCPRYVCKKCRKARERIVKTEYKKHRPSGGEYLRSEVNEKRAKTGNWGTMANNLIAQHYTIGWTDCGCNAGWESGVVLDPFAGSGTVGVVAEQLGYNSIQIDLNKEYCEMAYQRLKPLVAQTKLGREPSVIERIGF